MTDPAVRGLPRIKAKVLAPGADHYSAYVGPAKQWDFMGATQFRLLTTLGLREDHKVLDVGCGGLRAGRLLIPYLLSGHYFGIEPNSWLIDDAVAAEIGPEFIAMKAPRFSYSTDFAAEEFGETFDFIVAQSIFSHAGPEIVSQALPRLAKCLSSSGLILATFIHKEAMPSMQEEAPGWTYPGCTTFRKERVLELIAAAGLIGRQLPWYHPRQTWYAMALDARSLPNKADDMHLSGAVLRSNEFLESCRLNKADTGSS